MLSRVSLLSILMTLAACQPAEDVKSVPVKDPAHDKVVQENQTPGAVQAPSDAFQKLREQCPDMDEATIKGILKSTGPNRPDYDYYARSYCVSHEEAKRRLALQGEWTSGETAQRIHKIMAEIQKNESSTFAGEWIQHTPDYGLAVAFTKDAKATLAKYTDDPIFIAVEVPGVDKKTIERNHYKIIAMLEKLGVRYHSANREYKTNRFVVKLSEDKEEYIRDQAARGVIDLPHWVIFTTPAPLPRDIPALAIAPDRLKAFPHFQYRREFEIRTSMGVTDRKGTLRLKDGCLAFEKDGEIRNMLWQKYHAPDLTNPDRVGVMSRYNDDTVFEGEGIVLSGLQPGIEAEQNGKNNNPEAWAAVANETESACTPPYVLVEGFTSAKELEAAKFKAAVKEYMTTFKMPRAEAEKEVRKEEGIDKALNALIKDLLEKRRDLIAGAWTPRGSSYGNLYAGYGQHAPPRASIFVKGDVNKADFIPIDLLDFVHVQSAPRSLADGDVDIAFLKENLGDSADIEFNFFDGTISIDNIIDLKPLSELRVSMGNDWPEHFKTSLESTAITQYHFGPTSMQARYEMQQSPEYKEILDYAETLFPQGRYHEVDRAVITVMSRGLSDIDRIKRLETLGFGPLTAELDYQAPSRKMTDAIYAGAIVTAEPIEINTQDSRSDGYRSTVTFRVKDYIKGPLLPEQTFELRMKSGEDEKGRHIKELREPFLLPSFDSGFAEHKDWLLFLSRPTDNSAERSEEAQNETYWVLSSKALPGEGNQYTRFGHVVLSPETMRKQIGKMETPENLMAYGNSQPHPHRATCEILDGVPAEGLGEAVASDLMDVGSLTVKPHPEEKGYYLACDHEGPSSQQCVLEDGGFVTWLENGQRRHIKAKGGFVGVLLVWGKGVQCDAR